MKYEYNMDKMKINVLCKNIDEEMSLHCKMMNAVHVFGALVKPKPHRKKNQANYIVRNKEQYKFLKNDIGFSIETECIEMAVIFCSCLNDLGQSYTFETSFNILIFEKFEKLAVVNSFKLPKITINEDICGKRDPNTEQINVSTFDFNLTNKHLSPGYLSNDILTNALTTCQACYFGEFIDCSEALYDTNVIDLKRNEIQNIKFHENTLDYVEYALFNFQELLNIKAIDLADFLGEHNDF